MKKFTMLLMVLSLGLFALGCEPAADVKPNGDTTTPPVEPAHVENGEPITTPETPAVEPATPAVEPPAPFVEPVKEPAKDGDDGDLKIDLKDFDKPAEKKPEGDAPAADKPATDAPAPADKPEGDAPAKEGDEG